MLAPWRVTHTFRRDQTYVAQPGHVLGGGSAQGVGEQRDDGNCPQGSRGGRASGKATRARLHDIRLRQRRDRGVGARDGRVAADPRRYALSVELADTSAWTNRYRDPAV